MGQRLGPFSRFLGVSSGLIALVCSLVVIVLHGLPGALISLLIGGIWLLFTRFLIFMSNTGEIDVSALQEEIRAERQQEIPEIVDPARASYELSIEPNPQRILGASDRARVAQLENKNRAKPRKQTFEPDPEIEEDRAWAEMMRVL